MEQKPQSEVLDEGSEAAVKKTITINTWFYLILLAIMWLSLFSHLLDLHDYLRYTRPLHQCVKAHLYRCDIGETRIFITYRDGQEVGPDE